MKRWNFFQSLPSSLKIITFSSFIFALASFMVTPYLAVYLHSGIALDMKLVGFLVAISTFVQFGGGIFGGMIANRFGLKNTMLIALFLRSLGFILITFSFFSLLITTIAIMLIALGSAFYMPSNKAYMVFGVEKSMKPRIISISSAAFNAGMAIGPLLAAALINNDATLMFLCLGILFLVLTLVHHLYLVSDTALKLTLITEGSKLTTQQDEKWLTLLLRAKQPLFFNFASFYLYFYFQSFMGLYTSTVASVYLFGLIMFINFSLLSFIQLSFVKKITHAQYHNTLILGFALVGLGFCCIALNSSLGPALGTVIMTIGQSILLLRGDIEVVEALPKNPSIAFGLQRLSMGVAGLLSGIIGGYLYNYFQNGDLSHFWSVVSSQILIILPVIIYCKYKTTTTYLRGFNDEA